MSDALVASPPALSYDERLQDTIKLFGYEKLSPDQEMLIRASIEGQDVLGILPTGGGKSACFQIPGIVTRQKTIVVSPLIALQEDQILALRKLGIKAFALHSGMEESRKTAAWYYFKTASATEPAFLYISPELLMTEMFHQRFDGIGFHRIAVDEAHCVSTWGDTFRPDYQRIRVATMRLKVPHCSAFTATVDTKIESDIKKRIPLRSGFLKAEANPMRENLILSVERPTKDADSNNLRGKKKFHRLLQLLVTDEYAGPAIIYCSSKNGAANLYLKMRDMGNFHARHRYRPFLFHADIPYEDKEMALKGFRDEERPVVFATTAFGMGINRADVRQIIHYQTPFTLIDYAQQIGRGGRDGALALCTTFHSTEDYLDREVIRVKMETPNFDFVERVHGSLSRTLEKMTLDKRKRYNIRSFLQRTQMLIENSAHVSRPDLYMARFMAAVGLLQQSGLIIEDRKGLTVLDIEFGSQRHATLLGKTKMHERKVLREKRRIAQFFGSKKPTQKHLWEILKKD